MKRLATLSAAAVLTLTTLTACGGDGDEFCDQVKEAEADSANLSAEQIQEKFEEFADSAPEELEADFDALSGVDFSDPTSVDPDNMDELQEAFENIEQYITAECDVDVE